MQFCSDPNCECQKDPAHPSRNPFGPNLNGSFTPLPAPPDAPRPSNNKARKPGIRVSQMRNQKCPCGSGKKFKKCCMKLQQVMTPVPGRVIVNGWTEKDYYLAAHQRVA